VGAEQAGETIGQRLRRLRLERGLTQRVLAKRGVGYAYISRIERDERVPSMKALRALAGGLGVTAQYLETGEDLSDAEIRELRLGEAELSLRLEENPAEAELDSVRCWLMRSSTGITGMSLVRLHWTRRGGSRDLTGRNRRAHAENEPLDAAAVVRFTTYLSYALSDLGDLEGARTALASALSHAATAGDPYTRIRLYWSNARLASRSGDNEMARLSINRAIAL
jgi:transcriptional regulator with XRE-family HTH domain